MKTDIDQKIEKEFGQDLKQAIEQFEILYAQSKGLINEGLLRAMIFWKKTKLTVLNQS